MASRQPVITFEYRGKTSTGFPPELLEKLNGFSKVLQGAGMGAGSEIMSTYSAYYLQDAESAGIRDWTGRSLGSLRQQIDNPKKSQDGNGYIVTMPQNLIALDRLRRPFYVKLTSDRSITRWIKRYGSLKAKAMIGTRKRKAWSVKIKRRPFMRTAERDASSMVNPIVSRYMDKATYEHFYK